MKKLAVAVVALVVFTLVAEGALSLFLGSSILRLGRGRTLVEKLAEQDVASDRDALLEAVHAVGPYHVAEDPLVALTLQRDADLDYFEQRFHSDALGLRPRGGAPEPSGAFRIVVLGDSVAYGYGLPQEQNLAAQLEGVLREVAPPGARAVACATVALPGWNYRNSTRHLLDHLDAIDPDLVLFVPVENDLDDGYGVTEAGQRRRAEDAGVPHPLCVVAPPLDAFRTLGRERFGARGMLQRQNDARMEQWALYGGLTESARWRHEDMAATLAHLAQRLERVGARLVLAPYHAHVLARDVRARLVERGVELPALALLDEFKYEDGLGKNPHPNAETTRALALWAADGLFAQHLLPFAPAHALPEVPARLAGRRAKEETDEELRRWREELVREHTRALVARIEPAELAGVFQLYGGLNADGTLGIESALVLPAGRHLRLELAGAGDSPGLYPLAFALEVGGRPLGELALAGPGGAPTVAEFELGDAEAAAPFELRLRAHDWTLARVLDTLVPVSARLVAAESRP